MTEPDTVCRGQQSPAGDTSLLEGLRQTRPEACGVLYDRFAARIYRFALSRFSGDLQVAEEIVVQTMTDAIRDIARFNPKKSTLSSWLYGIARRRIQTEWRHSKRLKAWLLG